MFSGEIRMSSRFCRCSKRREVAVIITEICLLCLVFVWRHHSFCLYLVFLWEWVCYFLWFCDSSLDSLNSPLEVSLLFSSLCTLLLSRLLLNWLPFLFMPLSLWAQRVSVTQRERERERERERKKDQRGLVISLCLPLLHPLWYPSCYSKFGFI